MQSGYTAEINMDNSDTGGLRITRQSQCPSGRKPDSANGSRLSLQFGHSVSFFSGACRTAAEAYTSCSLISHLVTRSSWCDRRQSTPRLTPNYSDVAVPFLPLAFVSDDSQSGLPKNCQLEIREGNFRHFIQPRGAAKSQLRFVPAFRSFERLSERCSFRRCPKQIL